MKTSYYRLLRLAVIATGFAFIAVFLLLMIPRLGEVLPFDAWVFLIRGAILMAVGLIIAFKLPHANEHIFFALFLVNFGFNSWLSFNPVFWLVGALSWSLTSASFVYAMMKYPGVSARELYQNYLARRRPLYKRPVLFFTDDKKFWLIFFPVLIGLRIAVTVTSSAVFSQIVNVVVIFCGLIYFRISYNLAGKADRSRLAWIIWGVVVTLLLTMVEVVVRIFYPEAPQAIYQVLAALKAATVCISLVMGVFLSGFLDSALVGRGTIVYSAIFLSVVFLFSFVEHFIEHEIATLIHIETDMASAFLAGFLALLIQPLHEKLEHKLPKF
ncbi:MAG: hypothetical protein Q8896_01345 [Bacteroidota bacterium]|nr:hypothetical protein [Bacteroidota bacterium]